ncbi:MAG: mannose-1-phosphate guanylyltransferase [Myxococcota bacterium]
MDFAVVLAGGRGTRLWPLSRRARPKQCVSIDGGPTLLQRAIARTGLLPERVIVVTGPDMEALVRAQAPGCPVLVEPSARNTAPAVALAALEVRRRGGDVFAVLPSDHAVRDEVAFRATLAVASEAARRGGLVTVGIRPTRPETGFGWIEPGEGEGPDLPVRRFVEKPPRAVAEGLLAGGRHLWNAGMFVWRAEVLLDAVRAHLPATHAALAAGAWERTDATSIDYGVMERAANVRVVPADFGWSDVGSWDALAEVLPGGEGGAVVADVAVAEDAHRNVVHAPGRLVALSGVEDLLVVDTGDVLLVARRGDAQAVRALLEEVERRGLSRYT